MRNSFVALLGFVFCFFIIIIILFFFFIIIIIKNCFKNFTKVCVKCLLLVDIVKTLFYVGAVGKVRRVPTATVNIREHPYTRVSLP